MTLEDGDGDGYVKLEEGKQRQQQQQQQPSSLESAQGPWLVWPVFAISNLAGSTGGPVMVLMQNVNPISMVGWRHQVSSLVMLPAFIYESIRMETSKRRRILSPPNLLLLFLSSLALAGHFATYSSALYRTSVPHCLFLANTSPVYVALFVKLSGGTLHPLELVGIVLSLSGIGVFAVGNALESSDESSHVGDLFALISAMFTATYLTLGKSLRGWMPLFSYQFPVAVSCMIVLGLGGLVSGGWTESDAGVISGPFGWLRKEYWWQTVWLGAVPGVFGHAGYSYVLRYSAPLVMPTGLALQPITGSILSWLLGQTAVPGAWTWVGGAAILSGTMVVNVASARRQRSEKGVHKAQQHATADQEHAQKPLLIDHS